MGGLSQAPSGGRGPFPPSDVEAQPALGPGRARGMRGMDSVRGIRVRRCRPSARRARAVRVESSGVGGLGGVGGASPMPPVVIPPPPTAPMTIAPGWLAFDSNRTGKRQVYAVNEVGAEWKLLPKKPPTTSSPRFLPTVARLPLRPTAAARLDLREGFRHWIDAQGHGRTACGEPSGVDARRTLDRVPQRTAQRGQPFDQLALEPGLEGLDRRPHDRIRDAHRRPDGAGQLRAPEHERA